MDLLSELEEELREQASKEVSGVFTSVKEVRQFIEDTKPEKWIKISVELCVYHVEEFENRWRVMCIDKAAKDVFDQVKQSLDCIDRPRQSKFLFAITVWKPDRKHASFSRELKQYEVGHVYRVAKVYNLQMYNRTAEGNIFAEPFVKTEDDGDEAMVAAKKAKTDE